MTKMTAHDARIALQAGEKFTPTVVDDANKIDRFRTDSAFRETNWDVAAGLVADAIRDEVLEKLKTKWRDFVDVKWLDEVYDANGDLIPGKKGMRLDFVILRNDKWLEMRNVLKEEVLIDPDKAELSKR